MDNSCKVPVYGNERLDKNTVVKFVKQTKTDRLLDVSLNSLLSLANADYGTVIGYDGNEVPENKIGCLETECSTSGTAFATATGASVAYSQSVKLDATKMGALTYYVFLPANGSFVVDTTIFDAGTVDATAGNGSVFSTPIEANNGAGYYVVTVDTTQVPTAVVNAGWTPSTQGFVFHSVVSTLTAGQVVGFSTLQPRESMDSLECELVATGTCLSTLEVTNELEYADSACGDKKATKRNVSFNMEFKRRDGNLDLMDAGAVKRVTTRVVSESVTATVGAETINGINYGVIDLPELSEDLCGVMDIILNICLDGAKGKRLTRVCVRDFAQELSADNFIVLSTENEMAREGKIIFSDSLVGKEVCITFPVDRSVEEYCYSEKFADAKVSMFATRKLTNGKIETIVIPNLAITANGVATTSEEEGTYTITGDASSDAEDCKFYKIVR